MDFQRIVELTIRLSAPYLTIGLIALAERKLTGKTTINISYFAIALAMNVFFRGQCGCIGGFWEQISATLMFSYLITIPIMFACWLANYLLNYLRN